MYDCARTQTRAQHLRTTGRTDAKKMAKEKDFLAMCSGDGGNQRRGSTHQSLLYRHRLTSLAQLAHRHGPYFMYDDEKIAAWRQCLPVQQQGIVGSLVRTLSSVTNLAWWN